MQFTGNYLVSVIHWHTNMNPSHSHPSYFKPYFKLANKRASSSWNYSQARRQRRYLKETRFTFSWGQTSRPSTWRIGSVKAGNKFFFSNHIVHILPSKFVLKKLSLSVQSPEPSSSCIFLHSVQSYNTAICGRIGL